MPPPRWGRSTPTVSLSTGRARTGSSANSPTSRSPHEIAVGSAGCCGSSGPLTPALRVVDRVVSDRASRFLDVPETPGVVRDPVEDPEADRRGRLDTSRDQLQEVAMGQERRELSYVCRAVRRVDGADAKTEHGEPVRLGVEAC